MGNVCKTMLIIMIIILVITFIRREIIYQKYMKIEKDLKKIAPRKFVNKKTGEIYIFLCDNAIICSTNKYYGTKLVIYFSCKNPVIKFVREYKEFYENFEELNDDGYPKRN